MKLFYMFILIFLVGCEKDNDSIIVSLEGKYDGSFQIRQDNFIQSGSVSLIFSNGNYKQSGIIEFPNVAQISDSGIFSNSDINILFNPGLEERAIVLPSWILYGSYNYRIEDGNIILEKSQEGFYYKIILHNKIN